LNTTVLVVRVLLLLAWIGVSIQILGNAYQMSTQHFITVDAAARLPLERGWYSVTGGDLDYPHAAGQFVMFPGGTESELTVYAAFVPLIDPSSQKLVLLVRFDDPNANPTTLRNTSPIPLPHNVQGVVQDHGTGGDVREVFQTMGYYVPPDTPVLVLDDRPPPFSNAISIVGLIGLIPLFAFFINPRVQRGPVNLDWDFHGD
jgi:hypothetical protein